MSSVLFCDYASVKKLDHGSIVVCRALSLEA